MVSILTKPSEWEVIRKDLEDLGGKLPVENAGVIFAEFNEQKELLGYQILHTGALFAEGLVAKPGAHLRTIWNEMHRWLKEHGCEGRELLTMTRGDESGQRIGKIAEYLKCEKKDWTVYGRTI